MSELRGGASDGEVGRDVEGGVAGCCAAAFKAVAIKRLKYAIRNFMGNPFIRFGGKAIPANVLLKEGLDLRLRREWPA